MPEGRRRDPRRGSGNRCVRAGCSRVLKKVWKGLGDGPDLEIADIYPSRTLAWAVCFLFLLPNPPSFFSSTLGNCSRMVAQWERLSTGVRGLKRLSGLCSEILAHRIPSKAIVSLICPGTGGGSREFVDRQGQNAACGWSMVSL